MNLPLFLTLCVQISKNEVEIRDENSLNSQIFLVQNPKNRQYPCLIYWICTFLLQFIGEYAIINTAIYCNVHPILDEMFVRGTSKLNQMGSEMSELFTPERRAEVLENLQVFLQADDQIAGLAMMGEPLTSESEDLYNGFELLVIVRDSAVFASTYLKWRDRLSGLMPIVYSFESEITVDSVTYHMMLSNFLEVTLYFIRMRNLTVKRTPWRILFDQTVTQDLAEYLKHAYTEEAITKPTNTYRHMMRTVWRPILKCMNALHREEYWRAHHMLTLIREDTIQLAAINYRLDIRHHEEVDQLPDDVLTKLESTLPSDASAASIRDALHHLVVLFFEQAKQLEKNTTDLRLVDNVQNTLLPYIEAFG